MVLRHCWQHALDSSERELAAPQTAGLGGRHQLWPKSLREVQTRSLRVESKAYELHITVTSIPQPLTLLLHPDAHVEFRIPISLAAGHIGSWGSRLDAWLVGRGCKHPLSLGRC